MLALSHPADLPQGPSFDHSALNRLLSVLMDRIECGVLACGARGELLHANLAARRELLDARILRLVDDHVVATRSSHEAWRSALRDATLRHRSNLIHLGETGPRTMVAIMPANTDDVAAPVAVVMIGRRNVCSPLGLEMLASSHGLTFAESRVFRALVANCTAREIAASHGVAVATIRTQIQAVRDKLGVRSIDALLLRAAEVPPVTTRH